ncbi:uncharacterized protein LOC126251926 [Schistocerca nitens]|uniref:uncharacterized protein LOC126251926 n=1 Tax=Schistocerca nitens TaxID=7011 RepID=UPI0021194119|nr:uncharacterized protein LOC126251926 [Schistocerca nitens]
MCPLDIERIEGEILILAVEKRACIWDIRIEDYKDRNKKDAAWRDICCELFPDFKEHTRTERKSVGQKAQQKWRNIRDYYRKYTKKVRKPGSVALKRFKYVYADQLGFLDPVLESRDSIPDPVPSLQEDGMEYVEQALELSLTEDNTDNQIASDDPLTPDQPSVGSAATRRKINGSIKPDPDANFLDSTAARGPSTEDEDKSFLDSLLPTLRSFDTDQKLEFRVEALRLLQRIRISKSQTIHGFYAPYQSPLQHVPVHPGSPGYFPLLHTFGNFYNQPAAPQLGQMPSQQHHPKRSASATKQSAAVSQDRVASPTDTELSAFSEHSN